MSIKDAKILIVEDEIQLNRVMELMLQADGYYKIRCAFDGNEALNFIKCDKPDLILLDVMIPELDGYSLCKIIKNDDNYKNTKIIMITAKKMEEDVLEGFKFGAIDYITKPFSNKILLARIKAHLESLNSIGGIKKYKDIITKILLELILCNIFDIRTEVKEILTIKILHHLHLHMWLSKIKAILLSMNKIP